MRPLNQIWCVFFSLQINLGDCKCGLRHKPSCGCLTDSIVNFNIRKTYNYLLKHHGQDIQDFQERYEYTYTNLVVLIQRGSNTHNFGNIQPIWLKLSMPAILYTILICRHTLPCQSVCPSIGPSITFLNCDQFFHPFDKAISCQFSRLIDNTIWHHYNLDQKSVTFMTLIFLILSNDLKFLCRKICNPKEVRWLIYVIWCHLTGHHGPILFFTF